MRNLVPLLVRAGADTPALTLAGALTAGSNLHDTYGDEERRLNAAVDAAVARQPPDTVGAARAAGAVMTPSRAGSYAVAVLDDLRGAESLAARLEAR